ncbi:MAG: hypothetical protein AABX13_00870, partial [Nanoarchaeota archaeon]
MRTKSTERAINQSIKQLNQSINQQFLILFLVLLLALPLAIAPSHPEEIDSETGEIIGDIFGDPGITPDSIWYRLEPWWERTFESNVDHTRERFAEMQAMLTAGNQEAASRAGEGVRQSLTFLQGQVERAPQEQVLDQEGQVFEYERYMQKMQEFGAAPEALQEIDDVLTETQVLINLREEEIKEEIVQGQGLSYLEAEAQVEQAEEERFSEEFQSRITVENLQELHTELDTARTEFAAAARAGQEIPQAQALGTLLEEATEKVLQADAAWEAGQIGRAYGLRTAAEHLLENADNFLNEKTGEEKVKRVIGLANRIQEQDESRNQRLIEVIGLSDGLASFPPEQREQMIQAAKTQQLIQQRHQVQEEKRTQLQEEGKSKEEVARTLMEDFAREYEHIYGEKYYLPPVAAEPEVADETFFLVLAEQAAERLKETKGVVEGVPYPDPYTKYEYTFTEEGYEYKTPLGIEHEVKTPEIKDALQQAENPFETGTEVLSKVVETPDGPVEYRYTATGYEVRLPDGETEAKAYDVGKHELPGGGLIEVKPYGFEIVKEGGERKIYDYHPEYKNFVSTDGYVYMPPEGTAVQQEVQYDYGTGTFTFARGGGKEGGKWNYDPTSRVWSEERAEVGRTITLEGKTFTVDAAKGWVDEEGNPVPPPSGQPSSAVGAPAQFYQPITQSFAPVGTTISYEGKVYTVDSVLGWSVEGKAVPPPPGQPSSAIGSTGGYARVGTTATVDGRNYIVDPVKGWMDVETGNAVPPPSGYTSSAVGMRIGETGIGIERNYNFVEEGKAYYFPPGVDPGTVPDKSQYEVKDARGYDPAFGTDFGGSGPGYSVYTSIDNYGHIQDPTTGYWRPATREEAEQSQKEGKGGGENPTYSPAGFYGTAAKNYNFVEEGKAYYFPPGVNPGKVEDKSQYVVGDPRGYDPAYNTYFVGEVGIGAGQPPAPGTPGYTPGYTPGTSGYTTGDRTGDASYTPYTSYGHVRDATTGQWRGATAEEAAAGGKDYSPPGSTGTPGTSGSGTGGTTTAGGYDPAAAAKGWPGGAFPGGVDPGYAYSGPVEGGSYGSAYSGGYAAGSTGTYSGGATAGGYTGGSYGGTGGTYSGGYSAPSGGDTGGSTGGSTGGDTGGSAPSGGDTGSSTGGSTGGDTGGSAPSGG